MGEGGKEEQSTRLTVFLGDFLQATPVLMSKEAGGDGKLPTASWNRGCLVAVPPAARKALVEAELKMLTSDGRVLLNVVEYQLPGVPPEMFGPPYSLTKEDIEDLYGPRGCSVTELEREVDDDPSPKILKAGAKQVEMVTYFISKQAQEQCKQP